MDCEPTKEHLRTFIHNREKYPSFYIARMKNVSFGIVCPDRANYLGLNFEIKIIDMNCPTGAMIHIPEQEALSILREFGDVRNLEGALCWVHIDGPGASTCRFVDMVAER